MRLGELFKGNIPVVLAPMAGVADLPFRELVCSFGASATVSEMISSEALVRDSRKTYRMLACSERSNLIKIIQIMGADPKNMAESAIINETLGADVIDINMGCPVRKITSNNSGAALMKDENLAMKIVESVVKSVKIPVSVKMRLGWDAEHVNFLNLAKKFENVGAQMLVIHCRTRNQMYCGKANWSAISELRDVLKIPYFCNGDIKSSDDAIRAIGESRADGVMIGRGTLGKPWLLKQIMEFLRFKKYTPAPSPEDQYKIIVQHFQNVLDFYGESAGIHIFRKHFCWYSTGLPGSSIFRKTINEVDDLSFIKKCLEDFYSGCFGAIL
ncbi:MAG: tRNA dihydrouridine synthase DusB [Holosporaceae bacterium]|jgi:tRNA-dihydrouridine synthase B|nr:tRNA dihydrouridine synthase DusB [Holosporaceae bacterium]